MYCLQPEKDLLAVTAGLGQPVTHILSIDEVGRGALCGPVVIAATLLSCRDTAEDATGRNAAWGELLAGVTDSKKMSVKRREEASSKVFSLISPDMDWLSPNALDGSVAKTALFFDEETDFTSPRVMTRPGHDFRLGSKTEAAALLPSAFFEEASLGVQAIFIRAGDNHSVDRIGISRAINALIQDVLKNVLASTDGRVLVLMDGDDHLLFPISWDDRIIAAYAVKGDLRLKSIALSSVVAKVMRDCLMTDLDKEHPGYSLAQNKGYGSPAHYQGLSALGLSSIHRRSFNLERFARTTP